MLLGKVKFNIEVVKTCEICCSIWLLTSTASRAAVLSLSILVREVDEVKTIRSCLSSSSSSQLSQLSHHINNPLRYYPLCFLAVCAKVVQVYQSGAICNG